MNTASRRLVLISFFLTACASGEITPESDASHIGVSTTPDDTADGTADTTTARSTDTDSGSESLPGGETDSDSAPPAQDTQTEGDTQSTQKDSESASQSDSDSESDTHVSSICGNGAREGYEQCDDGNTQRGDGCSDKCLVEFCGDGAISKGIVLGDSFETGDLSAAAWTQVGAFGFEPTEDEAFEGRYSLVSSNKGLHNTEAVLRLDAYTDGNMCFHYVGESESSWASDDEFFFFIDGEEEWYMAGSTKGWKELCFEVAPGDHTFEWRYVKNGSGSKGLDAYYIDNVRLTAPFDEECDDGNHKSGDGCSATCIKEICGNGRLDLGEDCDDGNTTAGDGCSAECSSEICGDGVKDHGEECDDGNTTAGDGCSEKCTAEYCGSGVLDPNEECDDGNATAGDGCSEKCRLEYCGNGIREQHEVRARVEDFESGALPESIWTQGATYGFEITDDSSHSGSYSIQSINGGDSYTVSMISITAYTDGNFCFFWFGDTYYNYSVDFRFYVDDEIIEATDAINSWSKVCAEIAPGIHTFKWEAEAYYSTRTGDVLYIDDITFSGPYTEQCDDGNNVSGDGCSQSCTTE